MKMKKLQLYSRTAANRNQGWNMSKRIWLTIPSSTDDCPGVPNICNHQAIAYKNGRGSGWPRITVMAGIGFQKLRVRVSVSFRCRRSQGFIQEWSISVQSSSRHRDFIIPIADLVSLKNFGCLIKFVKRFCFTNSAARAPPGPAGGDKIG